MPPLSILIWLPALCGVLGAILPAARRRAAGAVDTAVSPAGSDVMAEGQPSKWMPSIPGILALVGSLVALALAIGYIADFHSRAPAACSTSPMSSGSPR